MPLPVPKKEGKDCASGQLALGLVIVVGFFFTLHEMLSHPIPQENHDIVITMLSVLGAGLMGVIGFYFATNYQAQKKDETINDVVKNLPPPGSPTVQPVVNMTQTQEQPKPQENSNG